MLPTALHLTVVFDRSASPHSAAHTSLHEHHSSPAAGGACALLGDRHCPPRRRSTSTAASSAGMASAAAAAAASSSCYLLIDARLRVREAAAAASSDVDAAAAAVWSRLLPFVHCRALLAATAGCRSDWAVLAVHDPRCAGSGSDGDSGSLEWLVRPPLLVGDLRRLLQRSRLPLAPSRPTPPPPQQQQQRQRGADETDSAIEPILVALKAVLQRQQSEPQPQHSRLQQPQQQSALQPLPLPAVGRPRVRPCHLIVLSPHLFSPSFVRHSDGFLHSLSRLSSECGFSFRLLHLRCSVGQLAPSSPLIDALRCSPNIRQSAHIDGVTSSACQQLQQLWSIAASLAPIQPLHATLLVGTAAQPQWKEEEEEEEQRRRAGSGSSSGSGSESGGEWAAAVTWAEVFNDRSDASGCEVGTTEGSGALSVQVLLLPAVRSLPLPAHTRVSDGSASRTAVTHSRTHVLTDTELTSLVSLSPLSHCVCVSPSVWLVAVKGVRGDGLSGLSAASCFQRPSMCAEATVPPQQSAKLHSLSARNAVRACTQPIDVSSHWRCAVPLIRLCQVAKRERLISPPALAAARCVEVGRAPSCCAAGGGWSRPHSLTRSIHCETRTEPLCSCCPMRPDSTTNQRHSSWALLSACSTGTARRCCSEWKRLVATSCARATGPPPAASTRCTWRETCRRAGCCLT